MIRPAPAAVPVHYPSSDGRPMAENDAQRNAIMYGIGALARHFRDRQDVYVSGDLLIYYEEGNPRLSIAPDVFVVFGVDKRERPNYKLWEEGRAPAFVLEVASPNTWQPVAKVPAAFERRCIPPDCVVRRLHMPNMRPPHALSGGRLAALGATRGSTTGCWRDDLGWKRSVYARLGVREYWQYDPVGGHLPARLQGERLTPSGYARQPAATALDGTLTLRSETLGLELRAAPGRELRFRDPATGDDLRSHGEEAEGRLAEAAARRAAEARVAELEAQLRQATRGRPARRP